MKSNLKINRYKGLRDGFFATITAIMLPQSHAQSLSALQDYSVITKENFSTTSDVEGRTLVGGNLTARNSSNFAIKLNDQVSASDYTLQVEGSVSTGNPLQISAGSMELGGSLNRRIINFNGGGKLVQNSEADYGELRDDLDKASDILAQVKSNSTTSAPGSQPAAFRFTSAAENNGIAVFSVNAKDLFNNTRVQQVELILNGASAVLINVAGSSVDWKGGNLVGEFTKNSVRPNIVWNFFEATTIKLNSKNMMGQILAPNAAVTSSAILDGSIYAKSFTTTSEVHLPAYAGKLDSLLGSGNEITSVPEPTIGLIGSLSLIIMAMQRRRATRAN